MTFDKSGQDTSLNVRVGVQVPQCEMTWLHCYLIYNAFYLADGIIFHHHDNILPSTLRKSQSVYTLQLNYNYLEVQLLGQE